MSSQYHYLYSSDHRQYRSHGIFHSSSNSQQCPLTHYQRYHHHLRRPRHYFNRQCRRHLFLEHIRYNSSHNSKSGSEHNLYGNGNHRRLYRLKNSSSNSQSITSARHQWKHEHMYRPGHHINSHRRRYLFLEHISNHSSDNSQPYKQYHLYRFSNQ